MTQELAHDLRGYLQLIVSCAQLIQLEADLAMKEAAYNAGLVASGVTDECLEAEILATKAEAEAGKLGGKAIDE